MLAAVMPLPRLLATPPVTKTYFDMGQGSSGVFLMLSERGPGRKSAMSRQMSQRTNAPRHVDLPPSDVTARVTPRRLGLNAAGSLVACLL